MDNIKLGSIITTTQQKDAVHIAIVPVMSELTLSPGDHIGLVYPGVTRLVGHVRNNIGIVDPFLKEDVLPGQRFWMFMYPGSISSLRHDWVHTAFDMAAEPKKINTDYNDDGDSFDCSICGRPDLPEEESAQARAAKYGALYGDTEERRESIRSIVRLAVDNGISYVELMTAAANFVQYGDDYYLWDQGDRFRNIGWYLDSDFWTHYDNITGTTTPKESKEKTFFPSFP